MSRLRIADMLFRFHKNGLNNVRPILLKKESEGIQNTMQNKYWTIVEILRSLEKDP